MDILIHRYLLEGKNKQTENTATQLNTASKYGGFFETDIRRLPSGEFYISHDSQSILTAENDARIHATRWKESTSHIALNIKDLGYEADLVNFLEEQGVVDNVFLFDFEIEFLGAEPQSYINTITSLNSELRCAVRVSDHNETVERALSISGSNIIWLDEFDSLWTSEEDVKKLKSAGKIIYCISPDLHGFSLEEAQKRWVDFISWGVDGICTDYPLLLKEILPQ